MALDFIKKIFNRYPKIEQKFFDELEENLIESDAGLEFTEKIIKTLKESKIEDKEKLRVLLKDILFNLLIEGELKKNDGLNVIIFCGVNGVGKTTSIAKLANYLKNKDLKVKLVAADTFRAAGIEQLEVWSQRIKVPIIKSTLGQDPAALVYDAITSAEIDKTDYLIIDTAGRMHTRDDLMRQMEKIYKVASKRIPVDNIEILLVLDATSGQNAFNQVKIFKQYLPVSGIFLAKFDTSFKAAILFRICSETGIPIKFIGKGEKIDDIEEFKKEKFLQKII